MNIKALTQSLGDLFTSFQLVTDLKAKTASSNTNKAAANQLDTQSAELAEKERQALLKKKKREKEEKKKQEEEMLMADKKSQDIPLANVAQKLNIIS